MQISHRPVRVFFPSRTVILSKVCQPSVRRSDESVRSVVEGDFDPNAEPRLVACQLTSVKALEMLIFLGGAFIENRSRSARAPLYACFPVSSTVSLLWKIEWVRINMRYKLSTRLCPTFRESISNYKTSMLVECSC